MTMILGKNGSYNAKYFGRVPLNTRCNLVTEDVDLIICRSRMIVVDQVQPPQLKEKHERYSHTFLDYKVDTNQSIHLRNKGNIMTKEQKELACKAIMNDEAVMCNMHMTVTSDFSVKDLVSTNGTRVTAFWNKFTEEEVESVTGDTFV